MMLFSGESGFTEYTGSRSLTRYLRCGAKEVVVITALTSASLFIYDGVQVPALYCHPYVFNDNSIHKITYLENV